jgi:hypothetical protein
LIPWSRWSDAGPLMPESLWGAAAGQAEACGRSVSCTGQLSPAERTTLTVVRYN